MNRMIVWVSVLMAICHFPTQMSAANLDTESSSTPVTEQRKVASFETIELQGSPTIYYQQGKNISVKVVGNDAVFVCHDLGKRLGRHAGRIFFASVHRTQKVAQPAELTDGGAGLKRGGTA